MGPWAVALPRRRTRVRHGSSLIVDANAGPPRSDGGRCRARPCGVTQVVTPSSPGCQRRAGASGVDCSGSRVDAGRFIFHQTGQSPAAGGRTGQNGPCRRRPRSVAGGGASSDGWFASAYDPSDLMRVFDTLWLKAGFTLHAYEFRAGSNGNGIIWAVPADAPLVTPGDCPRLDDTWLQPPQPPGAVRLMQAIEGDGSPWSYLSASILCREAAEFGASLARLRLERPDDSLQASAAGRWPRCVGRRAEADRRRPRR